MNKRLTLLLLLLLVPNIAAAGTFSDLPETSRYFESIEYLTELGVINGYPDGTFKPDNPVNRVEFLKLVLISSEIPTDIGTPADFPDVKNDEWYSKYVRKAYYEGWIEGYPDGTFKPEQTINKVEALKIVGEVQKWEINTNTSDAPYLDTPAGEWYTPFVAYAKDKNLLEETSSNFIPAADYTRAKISELLFRSFLTRISGAQSYYYDLIKEYPASDYVIEIPEDDMQLNEDPVAFGSYPTDFFDNVSLEDAFPNTFYLNEVYYFNGTINSGDYTQAFIFLAHGNDKNINYPVYVKNNTFSIPVIFRQTGNYQLGLILGNSGESKVINISVLPSLPAPLPSAKDTRVPTGLKSTYENNETSFSWDSNDYELIRLTFNQKLKSKTFIFRQGVDQFTVDYSDFEGFSEGAVDLIAEGADLESRMPLQIKNPWSGRTEIEFEASTHQYSYINNDAVTANNIPDTLSKVAAISFTGSNNTDILTQAAVIKPDGFVDLIQLDSSAATKEYYGSTYIPAGKDFTFNYQPETEGPYNLEINGIDGSAVLNSTVYVNTGLPLIPNFFDLYKNNGKITFLDIEKERNTQLNLINSERNKFGLGQVKLDEQLNALAQAHSNDMVARDFFNHINPDGEDPNDRRIEMGIETPVGENLAIAPDSEYTVYGLMQSGIHRNNILDPKWTKLGIGITLDDSNSMVTTHEFSSDTLTEEDLQSLKNTILDEVNQKREDSNLAPFIVDSSLETPADIWSKKMTDEGFFDFTAPDGTTLTEVAREYVPAKSIQALILEGSNQEQVIQELLGSSYITNSKWQKIGIGLDMDNISVLKATILFTTL